MKMKGKIIGTCVICAAFIGTALRTDIVNIMHSGQQMTDEAFIKHKTPPMQQKEDPLFIIKNNGTQKKYPTYKKNKKVYKKH